MTSLPVAPDFERFAAGLKANNGNGLVWAEILGDRETPVAAFMKLQQHYPAPSFLLESVEGGESRGRYSIIGIQPDTIWRCHGKHAEINTSGVYDEAAFRPVAEDSLTSLRRLMQDIQCDIPPELPPMAAGLIGYLGYECAGWVEELPEPKEDRLGLPDACLFRPQCMVIFDSVRDIITIVARITEKDNDKAEAAFKAATERVQSVGAVLAQPATDAPPVSTLACEDVLPEFTANFTREDFHAAVNRAKRHIMAGDIFQVVPSQRFQTDFTYPPFAFYRSLRHLNPSPFLFFLDCGPFQIIGSSPEILVRLRDGKVTIRPLAGTRKRGATPEEDKALAQDLLDDPKECAEHLMLLDLGRNDVGRVAGTGSVRVTEQMEIEYYSHVMHIVSNVEGDIRDDKDALDALLAGFPAGTVSGAPKIRAMEIIHELEPEKRGFYAGTVGYFSANGAMDSCIALRTACIKDNTLTLQAGCGVVADSDPEAEYQETLNKARALMVAAARTKYFV